MQLTAQFEQSYQNLVQTWLRHQALRESTDVQSLAAARFDLDHARWDMAAARHSLIRKAA